MQVDTCFHCRQSLCTRDHSESVPNHELTTLLKTFSIVGRVPNTFLCSGQHVACFKTASYEGSLRAVCQVQGHWASFEGHAISRGNEENQIEN